MGVKVSKDKHIISRWVDQENLTYTQMLNETFILSQSEPHPLCEKNTLKAKGMIPNANGMPWGIVIN